MWVGVMRLSTLVGVVVPSRGGGVGQVCAGGGSAATAAWPSDCTLASPGTRLDTERRPNVRWLPCARTTRLVGCGELGRELALGDSYSGASAHMVAISRSGKGGH